MTTLCSWTSVDSRGPSAIYLASDSRISWIAPGQAARWDVGRKLFAAHSTADIFGFSGDVLFPSILLGQVCSLLEVGLLFTPKDPVEKRAERLQALLVRGLAEYPPPQRRAFSVFYGTRMGERPIPYRAGTKQPLVSFHLFVIRWNSETGWTLAQIAQPSSSAITAADGSGRDALDEHVRRWEQSDIGGTSRAVFGAFCDSLRSGQDPNSGGAPQLVRLGPAGPAVSIGIVWQAGRYLFGQDVGNDGTDDIEWRNSTLEECDPLTGQRRPTAQKQPRPRL